MDDVMKDDLNLHAEDILKLEFEYAEETAEQAQNDRTAIVNMYLLLAGGIGSVAAALAQFARGPDLSRIYALLFLILALIGFFTLMKLVRLRQAWHDSALTMNRIKDLYLARFPDLEKAFRWRTESIPAPGKPWTITFNLSLLVIILDSVALAVAVHFLEVRAVGDYVVEVFAAVMYFLWQIWFYFFQLPLSNK